MRHLIKYGFGAGAFTILVFEAVFEDKLSEFQQ